MSLLDKALEIKQHRHAQDPGLEHIELAIAWAKGEVTLAQVTAAINHTDPYVMLSRSLRQALRIGRLKDVL
jgi:hypothetical protein